jgi:hypothetical protein
MVCVTKTEEGRAMEGTSDRGPADTYEDEGGLDPRGAATLLERTRREAQRRLDFRSPWLSLLAAAAALVAFGSVWLSVRGQHPYRYPTVVGLLGLYAVLAVRIGSVVYAHRRATAGVSGRSVTQQRAEGAGLAVALVAVYVVMGALINEGASDGIVYGLYVVTAPLLVMGAFWAGRSAVREDWQGLGISIAIMLVAAGSAFAGPRGVWLSDGVGCCVVLLGDSAIQAWTLRASRKGT